jgi:2'-5' RNA ligase
MQSSLFTGNSFYNPIYFLLWEPDAFCKELAYNTRKIAESRVKIPASLLPHISSLQFPCGLRKEAKIIDIISKVIQNVKAIELETNGLKVYDSAGALVIALKHQEIPLLIAKNIQQELILNGLVANKAKLFLPTTDLHITIAKGLKDNTLDFLSTLLKADFQNITFKVSKLTLLKSSTGRAPWDTVASFDLA